MTVLRKNRLSKFKWSWNKYHNQLKLTAKINVQKTRIKWDFPKGSLISVEGDTLAKMLIKHPVLNEEEFGAFLDLYLTQIFNRFIVELVDEQYKIFESLYSSPYTFRHIPQGNYFLRIIMDANNNRTMGYGISAENKQPERILYYPRKF